MCKITELSGRRVRNPFNLKTVPTVCILIALSLSMSVSAVTPTEEMVVSRVSGTLMEKVFDELGIRYTEEKHNVYTCRLNGYNAVLLIKSKDIQLRAGYRGPPVSLNRINDWNRTRRFGSVYLDNEGDPVLKCDLDFEGGVTHESLVNFIVLFGELADDFSGHLQ